MQQVKIIAFTHRSVEVGEIGRFHMEESHRAERLQALKEACGAEELLYLSTCNRVEFLLCTDAALNREYLDNFFAAFFPGATEEELQFARERADLYEGDAALRHFFEVASSLDSLVVGEREIITQVRNAYEQCAAAGLTGDTIRLLVKKTIETAKAVFTETGVARNPVSVVSLAWRKLRALNVGLDARILLVGAGVTNTAMARYLKKHGFTDFVIFNRTLTNGLRLAAELNGRAFPLDSLSRFTEGFDVIVTCTGAGQAVITPELYRSLVGDDQSRKVVIDLAVPNDLDARIPEQYDVNLIAVSNLQAVAAENLAEREKELDACREIIRRAVSEFDILLRTRRLERAMSEVPKKVKEIRETAVNAIFAREIDALDENSKAVLDRVIAYMEKKYISVPMKMAREILIDDASRVKLNP